MPGARPGRRPLRFPRRKDPGALAAGRSAWAEDVSCHGTLVTMTPGVNRSRFFSHSADWLCRRFSHQCPTTYSGMKTATMSRGLSRRIERTYSTTGRVTSRYGESMIFSGMSMPYSSQRLSSAAASARSTETVRASSRSGRKACA